MQLSGDMKHTACAGWTYLLGRTHSIPSAAAEGDVLTGKNNLGTTRGTEKPPPVTTQQCCTTAILLRAVLLRGKWRTLVQPGEEKAMGRP